MRLFTAVSFSLRRDVLGAVSAYRGVDSLTDVQTIASILAATVAADAAKPLLTWYDGATGERTELSGATLDNWVNKTANLLVDGVGLGAGDVAVVELPPHWQTAVVLLGCWKAGLAVGDKGDVSFGLLGEGVDYAVGLHPFALPLRDLPPGVSDWVLSVRAHGDHYGGPAADPSARAWKSLTHAQLAERAKERAAELGLTPGDRVLFNVDTHPEFLDWLLAPLAAGASMVLCRNAGGDMLARWADAERVSRQIRSG